MKALTFDTRPVRWTLCKMAGWISPRAFWSPLSGLRLADVPRPELPNGKWVRLRTILGGICGTDLAAIFQRNHPATLLRVMTRFPVVLGHENVAVIDEVGKDVQGWRRGQRVVVEPSLSCRVRGFDPPCRPCREGCFALCERVTDGPLPPGLMIGWNNFTGGSWSEEFVAHESQLHAVPDSMTDDEAVLVDPMAGALHAVLRRIPGGEENVLIQGSGILAIGVAACIRAMGSKAKLTAVVRHDHQAKLIGQAGVNEIIRTSREDSHAQRYDAVARAVGGKRIASLFGNQAFIGGYDVVYDCIGTGRSLTDAMKFTRARGTTVAVGTSGIGTYDTTPLWMKELNLIGCNGRQFEIHNGQNLHTYEIVFDLVTRGLLDLNGLLTHTFAIHEYRQALAMVSAPGRSGIIKAAFKPT